MHSGEPTRRCKCTYEVRRAFTSAPLRALNPARRAQQEHARPLPDPRSRHVMLHVSNSTSRSERMYHARVSPRPSSCRACRMGPNLVPALLPAAIPCPCTIGCGARPVAEVLDIILAVADLLRDSSASQCIGLHNVLTECIAHQVCFCRARGRAPAETSPDNKSRTWSKRPRSAGHNRPLQGGRRLRKQSVGISSGRAQRRGQQTNERVRRGTLKVEKTPTRGRSE